jgi:DNA invertase Pin-like site-specific DNA recombinase
MKVIGYLRVSTKGQTEEDKFGLASQREQIEAYCLKQGHEIIGWYEDAGVSGAKEERPAFSEILCGNYPEGTEAVIVAKSDRIARDVYIYFAYKNELRKKGLQVISVAEDFGDQGVFTVVLDAMLAAMAEIERQNITMRTSGGRKQKAKGGGYSGGGVPYGYCTANHSLAVNPYEAEIVREVYKLRSYGYSMQEIADTLNKKGYITRSEGQFTKSQVRNILEKKKTYSGMYRYGGSEWVSGEQEAII